MFADAVDEVEGAEQGRGDGDGAVDAALAFFQALEDEHAGGEVDAVDGEGQGLGEAAAGVGEGHTEGADLAVGVFGGGEEGVAFAPGQIFAGAAGVVEAHAVDRPRGRRRGMADLR